MCIVLIIEKNNLKNVNFIMLKSSFRRESLLKLRTKLELPFLNAGFLSITEEAADFNGVSV